MQKNREGAPALGDRPRPQPLGPAQVRALGAGVLLLDVRPAAAFGTGHVPGSINVGLSGQFASWAGTLLPADTRLVIVAEDEEQVDEAALRLSRVGLENVAGYLEGGVAAWDRAGMPLATVPQITVDELRALLQENDALQVVDVRRPPEYAGGHVPRAVALPLDRLERELAGLDPGKAHRGRVRGGLPVERGHEPSPAPRLPRPPERGGRHERVDGRGLSDGELNGRFPDVTRG